MSFCSEQLINGKNNTMFSGRQNSLDLAIHFFCFISVLLIGADKWGVNVGINFRIDQVFLVLLTLLLAFKNSYRITENKWIISFCVFTGVSAFLAFNILRGILFYFSILYNVIFVFYVFESYVKTYGLNKFISILRKTFYIQFFLISLQFLLKVALKYEIPFLPSYGTYMGIPRFNLWFYEPSYFATYIVFWFALALYMLIIKNDKNYFFDTVLSAISLVISTSTTGFLGIVLVAFLIYIIWIIKGITLKKVIFFLTIVCSIIAFRFIFSTLFDTFILRIFDSGLDSASGGRVTKWTETFNVFSENPFFGVGPGNYGLYLGFDAGEVPSNVTLELLATTGIFSTVVFYGISVSLLLKSRRVKKNADKKRVALLTACAFGLIIFTVILQANQGYLRLYHWMIMGLISGGIKYIKKQQV